MGKMLNMLNMHYSTCPFQRHVGAIQTHTDDSTRPPKGELSTEQFASVV